MKEETKKLLEEFYEPYNQVLFELLKWDTAEKSRDHKIW